MWQKAASGSWYISSKVAGALVAAADARKWWRKFLSSWKRFKELARSATWRESVCSLLTNSWPVLQAPDHCGLQLFFLLIICSAWFKNCKPNPLLVIENGFSDEMLEWGYSVLFCSCCKCLVYLYESRKPVNSSFVTSMSYGKSLWHPQIFLSCCFPKKFYLQTGWQGSSWQGLGSRTTQFNQVWT